MEEKSAAKLFTNSEHEVNKIILNWSNSVINFQEHSKLFPYVEETLIILKNKGIKLGIVTSKKNTHMKNEFNNLGINKYFDTIVTLDSVANPKPHSESLELALKRTNSKNYETLFVGDSIFDLECSKNTDVDFALASWGAKNDDKLYENSIILRSFRDILLYV